MKAQVTGWITANEAASRLGVKTATLYAYVSRGVLVRRRSGSGQSLFDPAEIERLARRGRPRRGPGTDEVVIESGITALGDDRPYFRGRDALSLAATAPFEAVAEWLWTGDTRVLDAPDTGAAEAPGWVASPAGVSAARAAQSGLPAELLPLERLQVIVPALAATDPMRGNLAADAVLHIGRTLVAGMVAALPGPDVEGTITDRLWAKLAPTPARPTVRRGERSRARRPPLADALRMALVLIADHELAASTFAVRVAASVRADPYAAVMVGLGTMSGPLHGGASLGAEALLAEASLATPQAHRATPQSDSAHTNAAHANAAHTRGVPARGVGDAIGLRLRRGERIPGLGHMVYKPIDGRATTLLDRVRALAGDHPTLAVADAVLAEARRRRLPEPNIDFALAVLTQASGMPIGAGEAIFAVARTAGWLAHAREEYERRTRLRPRAVYIGPEV